jgi:hypothetical protein
MAQISRIILFAAGAVGLAAGVAQAAPKGPKSPETPFKLYIYSRTQRPEALDSLQDVRKIVQEKKADWFTLTDDRRGADIVLDVRSRDYSQSTHYIVRGRVSTVDLDEADIIGQGESLLGQWRAAGTDMVNRLERFCREHYDVMARAQKAGGHLASRRAPSTAVTAR